MYWPFGTVTVGINSFGHFVGFLMPLATVTALDRCRVDIARDGDCTGEETAQVKDHGQ